MNSRIDGTDGLRNLGSTTGPVLPRGHSDAQSGNPDVGPEGREIINVGRGNPSTPSIMAAARPEIKEDSPLTWRRTLLAPDVEALRRRRLEGFLGGQDVAGDLGELLVPVARQLAQPPEGLLLVQAGLLHQQALGPLDDLAILQGLPAVGGLLAQGLELLEPLHGDRDRRLQVGLLGRLDQVGQDVVAPGALEELGTVVGRDQDERDRLLPADLRGGVDPVHVGHLDVGDDQVGTQGPALLDQVPAGLGHGHELVAQPGQDPLVIVPHVLLVVGDGDPAASGSWQSSRQGDDDLGPGPAALADGDRAPVGLDDPLGDGHAQAGALGSWW